MLWSKFDHASRIANMAMRPPYVRRQFSVHLLATTASTSSPITRRRISSHTGSRLCVHSWSSTRLHKSTANIRRKGGWCDKTCVEWSLSQQSFTSFKKLPTPTTVCLRFTAITQKLAEKSQLEIKVQDETWHDVNRKVALTPNKWGMHECQLAATCRQNGSYVLQYSQHWWNPRNGTWHTNSHYIQNIMDQVSVMIQESAANVQETGTGNRNSRTDLNCTAHMLHHVTNGSTGHQQAYQHNQCVAAASRLFGHFHRSTLATNKLMKHQRTVNDSKQLKVIQYCETYYMQRCTIYNKTIFL